MGGQATVHFGRAFVKTRPDIREGKPAQEAEKRAAYKVILFQAADEEVQHA